MYICLNCSNKRYLTLFLLFLSFVTTAWLISRSTVPFVDMDKVQQHIPTKVYVVIGLRPFLDIYRVLVTDTCPSVVCGFFDVSSE